MSTQTSPAASQLATAARESARQDNGQFGTQARAEATDIDLSPARADDSPQLSDVPVAAERLRRLHESIASAVEHLPVQERVVGEEHRAGLTVVENDYSNGARGGPDFSTYGDSAWTDPATIGATPMLPWSAPSAGRAVAKIDVDGTYRYLDPWTGEMVEDRPNEDALKPSVTDLVIDDLDDDEVRLVIDAAAAHHDEELGLPLEMRTYDPAAHHILPRLIRRARMYDSKHVHPFVMRAARDRFEQDAGDLTAEERDRLGEITGRTYGESLPEWARG